MFRRRDPAKSRRLELSIEVLDDVLNELERPQVDVEKEFANKVRGLTPETLDKASNLLIGDGLSTKEQVLWELAFSDYTANELEEREHSIRQLRNSFEGLGLIKIREDRFEFRAGAFGKLYLKYFYHAVKKDVAFSEIPARRGAYHHLMIEKLCEMGLDDCLKPASIGSQTTWTFFHKVVPPSSTCYESDEFRRLVNSKDAIALERNDLFVPLVLLPIIGKKEVANTHIIENYKG